MFSLAAFERKYDTEKQTIAIAGRRFEFYLPRSLDPFIESAGSINDFPLWAKIWPGALVLAEHLSRRKPLRENERLLEIGAGIGVAGVVAATGERHVTITDNNPDALQFAQANVTANQCPRCTVRGLDWKRPDLPERYDVIFGSEVIYKEDMLPYLKHLFGTYLNPQGQILLAEAPRKTLMEFYLQMASGFDLRVEKKFFRSTEAQIRLYLIHLKLKP